MHNVSVIIPVRRVEQHITQVLHHIPKQMEVILVGTSQAHADATTYPHTHIRSTAKSRAALMHTGALHASGEILLFLHPDTFLSGDAWQLIQSFDTKTYIGGGINIRFTPNTLLLRMIAYASNYIRMRMFHIIYGDQSLFVKKKIYTQAGGFRTDMPIFEDYEFSKRLQQYGAYVFGSIATTSSRRFKYHGVAKQMIKNLYVTILYWLDTPLERIKNIYET